MDRDNSLRGPVRYAATDSSGGISSLSASGDGDKIAVGSHSGVKILSVDAESQDDGSIRRQINEEFDLSKNRSISVNNVAWNHSSSHSNLILTSKEGTGDFVLWFYETNSAPRSILFPKAHDWIINAIKWNPSSPEEFLTASQDGTVKLWTLSETTRNHGSSVPRNRAIEPVVRLNVGGGGSVYDAAFQPDGRLIASAHDSVKIRLFDRRTPTQPVAEIMSSTMRVLSVSFDATRPHILAAGSADRKIRVWDIRASPATMCYAIETSDVVGKVAWRPQSSAKLQGLSIGSSEIGSIGRERDFNMCLWAPPVDEGNAAKSQQNLLVRTPKRSLSAVLFDEDIGHFTDFCWANENEVFTSTSGGSVVVFNVEGGTEDGVRRWRSPNISLSPRLDDNVMFSRGGSILKFNISIDQNEKWQFGDECSEWELEGDSFETVCYRNADISDSNGEPHIARAWELIGSIFSFDRTSKSPNLASTPIENFEIGRGLISPVVGSSRGFGGRVGIPEMQSPAPLKPLDNMNFPDFEAPKLTFQKGLEPELLERFIKGGEIRFAAYLGLCFLRFRDQQDFNIDFTWIEGILLRYLNMLKMASRYEEITTIIEKTMDFNFNMDELLLMRSPDFMLSCGSCGKPLESSSRIRSKYCGMPCSSCSLCQQPCTNFFIFCAVHAVGGHKKCMETLHFSSCLSEEAPPRVAVAPEIPP